VGELVVPEREWEDAVVTEGLAVLDTTIVEVVRVGWDEEEKTEGSTQPYWQPLDFKQS